MLYFHHTGRPQYLRPGQEGGLTAYLLLTIVPLSASLAFAPLWFYPWHEYGKYTLDHIRKNGFHRLNALPAALTPSFKGVDPDFRPTIWTDVDVPFPVFFDNLFPC